MPRWRTMIEPAGTSWPSPAFTPSRWPTLSRPFFELEPAFLWAISVTRPSSRGWSSWPAAGFGAAFSVAAVLPVSAAFALVRLFGGAFVVGRRGLGGLGARLRPGRGLLVGLRLRLPWRASRRARRPRRPAWRRPPRGARARSSRRRRPCASSSAALFLPSRTSVIRRTVSSWRWPFLTRLRAFGRYLNEMSFSPRARRTTSALTAASATIGVPIEDSSPSATSSTRSSLISWPGSTSSRSTSSSVPTSTRYCFPPVSITAYMDPLGVCGGRARRRRWWTWKGARQVRNADGEVYVRVVRASIELVGRALVDAYVTTD